MMGETHVINSMYLIVVCSRLIYSSKVRKVFFLLFFSGIQVPEIKALFIFSIDTGEFGKYTWGNRGNRGNQLARLCPKAKKQTPCRTIICCFSFFIAIWILKNNITYKQAFEVRGRFKNIYI